MDAPAVIYALRWLIHDTFWQTLTSRVFWILLGMSGIAIVFCLGVSVEGGALVDERELIHPKTRKLILEAKEPPGRVSLLFGAFTYPFTRRAPDEVRFILSIFASWIAGTFGIVMALVWTAGFVPESLHPSAASVMLAKPTPRWLILAGKYLGVVCFVGLHAAIFFLGTWIALGLRTDHWNPAYLAGIPLMTFHFAVIFSFSVMLAVLFRSAMACVIGSVLFWIVCYAVNYGRHFAVVYGDLNPGAEALPGFTVFLSEAGYLLLPKPADLTIMFEKVLEMDASKVTLMGQPPFATVIAKDLFHPILALATSCIFPVFALWASASQLSQTDY
ncbi:MAG: transcriptional regulator [Planctomycetes bacterium]|nr:transcriptional regulator [Planctomycetota bacterium]